MSAIKLAYSRK